MKKIKVLIVDDSPVFRALLTQLIDSDPALQVVASAEDPYQARELIKHYQPDVVTLDVEMPKMNGVQFLKNLMRLHPLPVVMISTLTQHGAEATLAALELGAVDYFPKPSSDNPAEMLNYKNLVNDKIKMAAQANVGFVQSAAVSAPITERVSTDYQLIARLFYWWYGGCQTSPRSITFWLTSYRHDSAYWRAVYGLLSETIK